MQKFYTISGDTDLSSSRQAVDSGSVLVIPSEQHALAMVLLRERYYQPAHPKPIPWIKRAAYRILGRPARFDPSNPIPSSEIRNILVLRYDGLGDYLLTTPFLQWIRKSLSHVEIDVLTSQRNDVLAWHDPTVRSHIPIRDRPQFHHSVLQAIDKLRGRRYDLAIALVLNNMTWQAMLASLLAPQADYVTIHNGRAAWLYGQVFHRQVPHRPWHQHWIETIFSIGPHVFEPVEISLSMPKIWLPCLPSAQEEVTQFLRSYGLGCSEGDCTVELDRAGQPFIIVNISASDEERSLGYDQVRSLCSILRARFPHYAIVLISSPIHSALGEHVAREFGPPIYFFHRSLFELIPLVEQCRWIITPDTALVHIAAGLRKPIVGLYHRPLTVCEWYPYDTRFCLVLNVPQQPLSTLPVDPIIEAAEILDTFPRFTD